MSQLGGVLPGCPVRSSAYQGVQPFPSFFNDAEVDAYALLDPEQDLLGQDQDFSSRQQVEVQMQLHANGSSGALSGWLSGPPSISPSDSPRQAGQSRQRAGNAAGRGVGGSTSPSDSPRQAGQGRQKAGNAAGKGVGGRKCTSLAQREAHKRYREKKKQSIAAMEVAVQTKRYELQQLLAENEQLKSRARVLETAERCGQEIQELMQLLDGLQSLALGDLGDTGADKYGSSCTSKLVEAGGRSAIAAAARAGAGSGSSSGQSSMPSQQDLGQPAAAAAAGARPETPAFSSSLLQSLMPGAVSQHAAAPAPEAASLATVKPAEQQDQAVLISLQNEEHWLQMAQRYLEAPESQQQQGKDDQQQDGCAAGPGEQGATGQRGAAPPAAAPTPSGAAVTQGAAASSLSPSSTAESVSVLAEMGSVDTPEQGLVIYKAFLQRASEMLALEQQQQQQGEIAAAAATEHQLNELTRATIGRLQPFLVARGQGVVYDWNARNLETQQPEEPPPSLWPAVLDVLQLAADTQRDALQCFDLFGAPLARLLEERVQLVQRYRELQQQGPPVGGVGSGGSSSCAPVGEGVINVAAAKTLEAVAGPLITSGVVLRALAANLERYQSLDGVFAHSLTTLLTGSQIAAACVASYPYLPRWHAMMSALKQRKEEEDAQQQQALQGYHASQTAQRRSSRVRTATQAAKESYL